MNIIKDLLIKDEFKRLGSENGAADIKSHDFFNCINWALLLQMKPPIIPSSDSLSKSNSASTSIDLECVNIDFSLEKITIDQTDQNPFKDFESVSILRN